MNNNVFETSGNTIIETLGLEYNSVQKKVLVEFSAFGTDRCLHPESFTFFNKSLAEVFHILGNDDKFKNHKIVLWNNIELFNDNISKPTYHYVGDVGMKKAGDHIYQFKGRPNSHKLKTNKDRLVGHNPDYYQNGSIDNRILSAALAVASLMK